MKNDFEYQNFEMFEEVVHNFGKSDGDIIYLVKICLLDAFHVQLDQKILKGL